MGALLQYYIRRSRRIKWCLEQPRLYELRSTWADGAVRCRQTQSGYDAAGRLVPCSGTPEVRGSRGRLLAPSAGFRWSLVERQITLSDLGWTTSNTVHAICTVEMGLQLHTLVRRVWSMPYTTVCVWGSTGAVSLLVSNTTLKASKLIISK